MVLVSTAHALIIFKRSIDGSEGDIDEEESAFEIENDKELSAPTVETRPTSAVAPHTAPSLDTAPVAPPSQPSTAYGSPISQSADENVEVVSIEQGKQQIKPLKQKEG